MMNISENNCSIIFANQKFKSRNFSKEQQMIAHDLRRPFTQLKLLTEMMKCCSSMEDFENIRSSVLPGISESIHFGEDLVELMLAGKNSDHLKQESISPSFVLKEAIKEALDFKDNSELDFQYNIQHHHFVKLNKLDLKRILSNILNNAIEAMKGSGQITLKTNSIKDNSQDFTEFQILNTGSHIPSEDLKVLFEDFYTKGKPNGHGLGLSIVKQIVTENGGKIFCRSEKNEDFPTGFVEFTFTLPSDTNKSDHKLKKFFSSFCLPGYSLESRPYLKVM